MSHLNLSWINLTADMKTYPLVSEEEMNVLITAVLMKKEKKAPLDP